MEQEKNDGINKDTVLPLPIQQNRPALSCGLKIRKMMKTVLPCLGKFRPVVGQCCHQCTPDSLLGQNYSLGFHNLLSVNETQTRYRGWLVRRVCCALFVSGCKVYGSPVSGRVERVCQSNRVKKALTAEHKAPEGGDGHGFICLLRPCVHLLSLTFSSLLSIHPSTHYPLLTRFVCWAMLKMFASVFGSIQVNLNHLSALHRASQEGSLLVYVYVRQSAVDCALIPLVLFYHSLRVPYTVCPLQIKNASLRSILQKVGVVLLPPSAPTEEDAEMDTLYQSVMTALVRELLHEGQAISIGVSERSGLGGQWLARIRQLIKEGSVPDVSLVPVGISYDCVPKTYIQVDVCKQTLASAQGSVRIHLAQPFSVKEMCESGRCRVDEWLPLQDLLLPVILNNRAGSAFGQRRMSWLLPSSYYASELEEPSRSERNLSIAIILHLIFYFSSSFSPPQGVSTSVLCRDVAWLTEELLFRNKDVGFGGSLTEVVHYSLSLLAPHLIIAAAPSKKDPLIVPCPSLAATLHLSYMAKTVTHAFISEAVGACAVSAMLCEVAHSGVSSSVRSDVEGVEVKGDTEFDVVLCQSELTARTLQLCHLLPPGFMPPCQSSQSFALDAIDSLVRCGILIQEEVPRDVPICDFWKKQEGPLTWTTSDDPYHSDSDCEEPDLCSYKIRQPSHCPEMLFFLCRMLAGHLRALCWTTIGLDLFEMPLAEAEFVAQIHSHLCDTANKKKQHYGDTVVAMLLTCLCFCSLFSIQVLLEEWQKEGVFLAVSPLFQLSENRQKLHRFISQYLYN
uniref:Glycerol-3-phosphate acyltransferase 2, mitochondrial n=1 Tax=Neolamprologus brichardi TaxID=32507 RepID=A0A3Q4HIJ9_NEOBR